MDLTLGTTVSMDDGKHHGVIAGTGNTFGAHGEIEPILLVRIDPGFYDPRGGYVSLLACHPDCLRAIE